MPVTKEELYHMLFQNCPDLLDVKQAAATLGVSTKTVYKLLGSGTLVSIKVGREHRIAKMTLLEYLKVFPSSEENKPDSTH